MPVSIDRIFIRCKPVRRRNAMTVPDDILPKSSVPGLIPTLNNTGWMTESLDEISVAFADYAGSIEAESLDIGCAYGIATLMALDKGARVFACDIEPKHLDILAQRIPESVAGRYRSKAGAMPGVDFDHGSFGAVLASRVLHFLRGEDVEQTVVKMYDWLQSGGRVFLVTDSPYTGPWKAGAGEYEQRKAAGEPWPGLIEDFSKYLPENANKDKRAQFINPMDPDILSRVCEDAGFEILQAGFLAGGTKWSTDRDHAGVIAQKA
jgi:SAM-dependent methyltransferase